ncbi:MAG TPA: fumarylacetoacetate hydrolase family protein [Bacteroidales bacterium]|nr:fumarylacetoacetate hydrolase family protein [Bacteroidales bacterium]HSA42539.1 fumarylacetoacetate hydrolase family protein [Bacteroidales bacterium]
MKIICIGRNYLEHARELNSPVPSEPVFFLKPDSAIVRNNAPFFLPDFSNEVHYEVELVFRIGKLGKSIGERFAMGYIDAVALGIDFTARDLQQHCKEKGLPWEKSKAFDGSAPISRFLPFPSENHPDEAGLCFHLDLNGKTVQKACGADMLFPPAKLIAHVSRFMTLKTGDLLFTGTPAGVGPVSIGDHLEAWLGEKKMLDFWVR